ncbi:MAG TPA: LysR family transcriptional regulator [Phycisphaerae bacterium]|nr:LysR family transcriptional regulator [Phycisphaerae bacterium]HUT58277.1 LysR family transcriptional regulator [Phycisphaerae bacterium]
MNAGWRRKLKAKSKVWLELAGRPVFGDGKAALLEQVDRTGSLKGAAAELGMSYRGLWGRLRQMERRLGVKLVERRVGGPAGGGSRLTPQGRRLLGRYQRFREGINAVVDARFRTVFER